MFNFVEIGCVDVVVMGCFVVVYYVKVCLGLCLVELVLIMEEYGIVVCCD